MIEISKMRIFGWIDDFCPSVNFGKSTCFYKGQTFKICLPLQCRKCKKGKWTFREAIWILWWWMKSVTSCTLAIRTYVVATTPMCLPWCELVVVDFSLRSDFSTYFGAAVSPSWQFIAYQAKMISWYRVYQIHIFFVPWKWLPLLTKMTVKAEL